LEGIYRDNVFSSGGLDCVSITSFHVGITGHDLPIVDIVYAHLVVSIIRLL